MNNITTMKNNISERNMRQTFVIKLKFTFNLILTFTLFIFAFNTIETFSSSGNVEITDSFLNVGSQLGGSIRIIGGELVFDGGGIDLDPVADSSFKSSGDLSFDNGFELNSEVTRSGVYTNITFIASNISILNGSEIETDVDSEIAGGLGADLIFHDNDTFELGASGIFTRCGFTAYNSVSGDVLI